MSLTNRHHWPRIRRLIETLDAIEEQLMASEDKAMHDLRWGQWEDARALFAECLPTPKTTAQKRLYYGVDTTKPTSPLPFEVEGDNDHTDKETKT